MLGIDTNILVRFLVRDDESQFEKARRLIRREIAAGRRVFVSQSGFFSKPNGCCEAVTGLRKIEIIGVVSGLLDANDVQFEDEPAVEEAVFVWKDMTVGFADCLIGARNKRLGCSATATLM